MELLLRNSRPSLFERILDIRQLVIVALRRILRQVLNELPIVALGIVEINAPAIGKRVRRR